MTRTFRSSTTPPTLRRASAAARPSCRCGPAQGPARQHPCTLRAEQLPCARGESTARTREAPCTLLTRLARSRRPLFAQRELGLPVNENIPLIAFIGRLDPQKGADILLAAAPNLLKYNDVQLVCLGAGNKDLENGLRWLEGSFRDKARGCELAARARARAMGCRGAGASGGPGRFTGLHLCGVREGVWLAAALACRVRPPGRSCLGPQGWASTCPSRTS